MNGGNKKGFVCTGGGKKGSGGNDVRVLKIGKNRVRMGGGVCKYGYGEDVGEFGGMEMEGKEEGVKTMMGGI